MSWPPFLPWNDSRETQAAINEFRSSRRQQRLSAVTSQYANHRPEAMHPDVRGVSLECAALDHTKDGSTPCRRLKTKACSMLGICNADLIALKYSAFILS